MQMQRVTITPEKARQILKNNPTNRNIRPKHVQDIARDMSSGNFQLNGDTIRIAKDGSLLDGQHRLSACIMANTPFETFMIYGVSEEARTTIDAGIKRSLGDRLMMSGVSHANVVGTALRVMAAIARNVPEARITPSEAEKIMEAHPQIVDSAAYCRSAFPKTGGVLTAVHYIGTYTGHGYKANQFRNVWKDGVPTYSGDAAHFLRETLLKDQMTVARNRMTFEKRLRLLVHSWNKFADNEPMRTAKVPNVMKIPGWSEVSLTR